LNSCNNTFPNTNVDSRIKYDYFRADYESLNTKPGVLPSSPTRFLCDSFWNDLHWESIITKLNNEIHVLEVGCGSGKYGEIIQAQVGSYFNSYFGIDVQKHKSWNKLKIDDRYDFIVGDAKNISSHLPGKNVIITQSALEHFDEDMIYFEQIQEYVNNVDESILQIHLIPSASCITTYPWHGIRQYTPRNISKITNLFSDNSSITLTSLGSRNVNKTHRKYITVPLLFLRQDNRFKNRESYLSDLRKSVNSDNFEHDPNSSAFYALTIHTNPE